MKKCCPPGKEEAAAPQPHPADRALERLRFAGFCITLAGAAFSISVASIGSVLYAAALAASWIRRPSASGLPRLPFAPVFAALAAALAGSIVLNGFPAQSGQGMLKYIWGFLALYAALDVLRGHRRWTIAAGTVLLCEGLAAFSGIGQDFWGRDFICGRLPVLYTDSITRITGPFKHCNDFGTFLIPGWLFGCSLFVERLRRRNLPQAILAAVFMALIGWAVVRTLSRGAMIGMGAGMLVLALTLPYRRWIFGVMGGCAAAAWLIPSPIASRLHQLLSLEGSLGERMYLIRGVLKMIHESPWFGLGPNTYSEWFPVFNPPDSFRPVVMYAHNSYLQFAAETGWIGLTLYLALIAAALCQSALLLKEPGSEKLRWIRAAALASAVGLLVNALFESLLQSTQLRTLFWCMLGIAIARVWPSGTGSKAVRP